MQKATADLEPSSTPAPRPRAACVPGLAGFSWRDLHDPLRLADLTAAFDRALEAADPALSAIYQAHRDGRTRLSGVAESDLLIALAARLSRFVGVLFGVEEPLRTLRERAGREAPLFRVRRDFVQRRVFKKGAANRPAADELPSLDAQVVALLTAARAVEPFTAAAADEELSAALLIDRLLEAEKALAVRFDPNAPGPLDGAAFGRWRALAAALNAAAGRVPALRTLPAPLALEAHAEELPLLRALLDLCDRWLFALRLHEDGHHRAHAWTLLRVPKPLDFERLVPLRTEPLQGVAEALRGLPVHRRCRDGFRLTDARMPAREAMGELETCLYCHDREKDSCSSGFREKDASAPKAKLTGREAGQELPFKKNPLGIPLTGCPLEERISEAHLLGREGDPLAALAVICIDNPMAPGTGHRICNDCMKACIFQKQEPVNIPQAETRLLTDVLSLRWGFEIWSLLTRWNPLRLGPPGSGQRQHPRPYTGLNVMVVGMGPAGYTLAHHLCNEGFFVAGIDGLKVEPLAPALLGESEGQGGVPDPVEWVQETLGGPLDERITSGFGGVSEYGITVRWDKRFLDLLHLNLARRRTFKLYGGTRFGGGVTLDDAWVLGFHHVALAAGAGKPTLIPLKNNLLRGVRKASDFLMALQLTGAFKERALANLQVRLPAVVIGGGLTAVDTATELAAYYPVQVEKLRARHLVLCEEHGEQEVLSLLDEEEREVYAELLAHGAAVAGERAAARAEGRPPDFARLVDAWGGVTLAYRKGLGDAPAYRLNHEEVTKAFEEGIAFAPGLSPLEAVPDAHGAVRAVRFARQKLEGGKWRDAGEVVELPARTLCVAAGTSPNVTLGKENPGLFEMDDDHDSFRSFRAVPDAGVAGGVRLEPAAVSEDLSGAAGFFTSYNLGGRLVSYFGDNHPFYAGSVVKAMASAKDGFPLVSALFAAQLEALDKRRPAPGSTPDRAFAAEQRGREAALAALRARLDGDLLATVFAVHRLTPTIVEVVLRAPAAARRFLPGQFYRLQNYEALCARVEGTPLLMEGLALTGAWTDPERGLLGTIVLEMGGSSTLCALLRPGEPVVLMGPTGAPSTIPKGEDVVLCGGGLGNAVLFSIGKALRANGCRVIYFAGYRSAADVFKRDEIEASADVVIWSVDKGSEPPAPRRPQDRCLSGNMVEAMVAYATGGLGAPAIAFANVKRIIAIGSDRMMAAVTAARHPPGPLAGLLPDDHVGIASINSPMQCMMKEICAQCLQKHRDPKTGKESVVFTCMDQDQEMDRLDWSHLRARLRQSSLQEKLTALWIKRLLHRSGLPRA